jgi:hypothetical protein
MLNQRQGPIGIIIGISRKSKLNLCLLLVPICLLSACSTIGLLLGTEKPVDEKSKSYQVENLSQGNADWTKVDPSTLENSDNQLEAPDSLSTSASDVTYISRRDASMISLNSSCDSNATKTDLRSTSDELFYGMRDITYRHEIHTAIQNIPALQTTARGNYYRSQKVLRTVVFRRGSCLFDFMYLTGPDDFNRNENIFYSFVASFRFLADH